MGPTEGSHLLFYILDKTIKMINPCSLGLNSQSSATFLKILLAILYNIILSPKDYIYIYIHIKLTVN